MKTLRLFVLLSLLLGSVALGQNPPRPPIPGLPGFPEANNTENKEGDAAPQNLTQTLKKPDPNALYPGGLELLNVDGFGMAALYQSVTGKRVLVPASVKDVQFSFVQAGGLTNSEVAQLLEEFLLIEGYQLNPSRRNPDIVTLLGVNQPGGPANTVTPVKLITDPARLALENGVVTYVMKFQYLKPEEAQRAFTQIYGQFRPGGTVVEVRNASSLVITEKAALIQSLVELKKEIDVPSAELATDWVEIQFADVQELADQLNQMFSSQQSSSQSAGVQRRQGNNAAPPIPGLPINAVGGAANSGAAGEENPPTITPDSRTNRLFLMGRPIDLIFIKELISQWDVPSSKRNFLRRKLNYLPVSEFMSIAESAISSTLGSAAGAEGQGGGGGRSTANAPQGGLGNNGQGGNNNNRGGAGGGGIGGGGGTSAASLSGSDRPTQPESVLVGSTLLVSDNVTNSLIVQGPPHHIEIVESLINELDIKNEQVAITAVFGRYTITDGLSFGANVSQLLNGNGIGFGTNNGGNGSIIDPTAITDFSNLIGDVSGIAASGVFGDFGVFVNALETYTDFRAFDRPTVFTTNNKEARISSGSRIAVPTNTFQGLNGASGQSTNVEFIDVALELLVRPLVNSEDEITLEISIVREALGEDRDVGELVIPDLTSDQLETTVTVPVGSAVLLGGLITEGETSSKSGVPILRAIPILGNLFKDSNDEFLRSELVIMIRPTIVDGKVSLNQFQGAYDHGSALSRESRAHFDAPRFEGRQNSAVDRIFRPGKQKSFPPKIKDFSEQEQRAPQTFPKVPRESSPRQAMSPLQQAIFDKKKRAEEAR